MDNVLDGCQMFSRSELDPEAAINFEREWIVDVSEGHMWLQFQFDTEDEAALFQRLFRTGMFCDPLTGLPTRG